MQVETLDRFAVSQIEDRLTTLTFHRNGDGDSLTVCRDIALGNSSLALAEVDALHEVEVSTRNLKGTTGANRINVVGSDGRLHQCEGNIDRLFISHDKLQRTLGSSLRNSLDNNLVGSNGEVVTADSVSTVELDSRYEVHILTVDGQCLTSLDGIRNSYSVGGLHCCQFANRNLYARFADEHDVATGSSSG